MLKNCAVFALSFCGVAAAAGSSGTAGRAGEAGFRELYKELVETNTALSNGSCTLAAERMAARLKAAGIEDARVFVAPDHPKEGGLVAVYPGKDPAAKAILLLAHIDVVEAKREDWTRDPFVLVEENGNFYARGAVDDKAEAAIWVDTLVRYAHEKFKPRRAIKLALTCGEETAGAFNGAEWLTKNHRDWIDAEFAINEGAWGETDAQGQRLVMNVQVGEKAAQNYRLARNLLEQHPDLIGLYNIGGASDGIGRALKEAGCAHKVVFVGHGLTPDTRALLIDGTMDAVITQYPHTTVMNVVHVFVNLRDRRDVLAGVEPVRISIVLRDNLP